MAITVQMTSADYEAFLRYQSSQHAVPTATSQFGYASAYATKSPSTGPWIVDSGATDHLLCGIKDLFSNLTYSDNLPPITVADGNKTTVSGIGKTQPISSLSLDSVLYVPNSPFNLISVNRVTKTLFCSITFTPDSVLLQDLSTGRIIGEGHESQEHYYLGGSYSSICSQYSITTLSSSSLWPSIFVKVEKDYLHRPL